MAYRSFSPAGFAARGVRKVTTGINLIVTRWCTQTFSPSRQAAFCGAAEVFILTLCRLVTAGPLFTVRPRRLATHLVAGKPR